MYEGLVAADQRRLDALFKRVTRYKVAISNARPLRPIIVLCILMLLEVYKMNHELHHVQYKEIRRLRKALEEAGLIAEQEAACVEEEDGELPQLLDQLHMASLTAP